MDKMYMSIRDYSSVDEKNIIDDSIKHKMNMNCCDITEVENRVCKCKPNHEASDRYKDCLKCKHLVVVWVHDDLRHNH
jgi:hypothetical protein